MPFSRPLSNWVVGADWVTTLSLYRTSLCHSHAHASQVSHVLHVPDICMLIYCVVRPTVSSMLLAIVLMRLIPRVASARICQCCVLLICKLVQAYE